MPSTQRNCTVLHIFALGDVDCPLLEGPPVAVEARDGLAAQRAPRQRLGVALQKAKVIKDGLLLYLLIYRRPREHDTFTDMPTIKRE